MTQATDYITTSEACQLIGVSKTIVKRLADEGILKTWKTPGGHRRLLKSSVEAYINLFNENNSQELDEKAFKSSEDQPLKILIVEDDPQTAMLLTSVVNALQLNTQIEVAKDGYEGLMKIGENTPDIIFSDLNMPNMDGYALINAIRNFNKTKGTTIIIITAEEASEINRKALPTDVVIMHKPIQIDIIKSFVTYEYNIKHA